MAKRFLLSLFIIITVFSFAAAQNTNTRTARQRGSANAVANAGNYISEMPIPPPANSTVRGRVYYEDTGRPVKRASIMLLSTDSNGPGEFSVLTDGNGDFVLRNVRGGSYYAMVNAPGVVSPLAFLDISRGMRSPDDGGMDEAAANFEKIIVDGVNEVVVQIAAKRGGAVNGRIVYENGDPAIGVRVEVLRKTEGKYLPVISNLSSLMTMFTGGLGSGQADDRGMFRFSGLPAGEYVVKVSESAQHTSSEKPGYGAQAFEALFFGGSSFLTFYFPDASDPKDAQVLNVLTGQELGEINITIPDKSLFHLSGKVISIKDKKPLAGARVSLQKKNDNVVSLFAEMGKQLNTSVTDEEGNWNFKELPKGDYSIIVEPNNEGEYTAYNSVNAAMNVGSEDVRPKGPPKPKFAKAFRKFQLEDKDLTDVIIELGYGAVISGTVSTENNKEMPSNVYIQAFSESEEQIASTSLWNYQDEREGAPAQQKPYNDFRLENIAAGKINLRFLVGDDDFYVKSAKSGMIDLLTAPLDVKEGDVLANVKIVLASDTGTFKGKVIDVKDQPVANLAILLVPTDAAKKRSPNFFKSTRSGASGEFEMKLPPGEYAIVLLRSPAVNQGRDEFDKWLDEAMKTASKVSIDADKTTTMTIKKPAK